MKKKYYQFIAVVLFFSIVSCSRPFVQVVNIKEAIEDQYDVGFYALPKAIIDIEIDVKRTYFKRGPFCEYADKYLSISNAGQIDSESWELIDTRLESRVVADTNQIYLIKSKNIEHDQLINLSASGIILGINSNNTFPFPLETSKKQLQKNDFKFIQYHEMSVSENFNKGTDKKYKRVKKDSTYVRVPILQSQVSKKSFDEKAKEAAHFIVKLRKRRFKLIAGMYDKFYSGPALELALKELEREEEEYLSLFIGKKYEEVITYNFSVVPDDVSKQIPAMICRFSEATGLIDKDSREGIPILVEIKGTNQTAVYADYLMKKMYIKKKKKEQNTGLCYRLPEQTVISILKNKTELLSTSIPIPQYGVINRLSPHYLIGNYVIEFNSKYGNITKIEKK